jgi:hypothetical protein
VADGAEQQLSSPVTAFISYAERDGSEFAKRLEAALEAKDFDVWVDYEGIALGTRWREEIQESLVRPLRHHPGLRGEQGMPAGARLRGGAREADHPDQLHRGADGRVARADPDPQLGAEEGHVRRRLRREPRKARRAVPARSGVAQEAHGDPGAGGRMGGSREGPRTPPPWQPAFGGRGLAGRPCGQGAAAHGATRRAHLHEPQGGQPASRSSW